VHRTAKDEGSAAAGVPYPVRDKLFSSLLETEVGLFTSSLWRRHSAAPSSAIRPFSMTYPRWAVFSAMFAFCSTRRIVVRFSSLIRVMVLNSNCEKSGRGRGTARPAAAGGPRHQGAGDGQHLLLPALSVPPCWCGDP